MTEDLLARLMDDLDSEWSEDTRNIQFVLSSVGTRAIVHLLELIETGTALQKKNALHILKELKSPDTLPHLLEIFKDAPSNASALASLLELWISLVESGAVQPRGFRALRELSKHPERSVRELVLQALSNFHCQAAMEVVSQMSDDQHPEIQERVKRILKTKRPNPNSAPSVSPEEMASSF